MCEGGVAVPCVRGVGATAVFWPQAVPPAGAASPSPRPSFTSLPPQVYSECPSYDELVPALLERPIEDLPQHVHFKPGVPVKPMLAKPTTGAARVPSSGDGAHPWARHLPAQGTSHPGAALPAPARRRERGAGQVHGPGVHVRVQV